MDSLAVGDVACMWMRLRCMRWLWMKCLWMKWCACGPGGRGDAHVDEAAVDEVVVHVDELPVDEAACVCMRWLRMRLRACR